MQGAKETMPFWGSTVELLIHSTVTSLDQEEFIAETCCTKQFINGHGLNQTLILSKRRKLKVNEYEHGDHISLCHLLLVHHIWDWLTSQR